MTRLSSLIVCGAALLAAAGIQAPRSVQADPAPAGSEASRSKSESSDTSGNALQRYPLGLEFHPIGAVLPKGKIRFTNFIPMQPAGFHADEFEHWLAPTYGLGEGWEVTAGFTGAQRIGPGGNALFYGAGIQKQFVKESSRLPAVSIGAYGMFGPHDQHNETVYLAATKRVWHSGPRALFLDAGAKLETFDGNDYGSDTGVRPYFGATLGLTSRLFLIGEISPSQDWQPANMYSVQVNYQAWRHLGVAVGLRNNGYKTHPFFGVSL
jgi:hypothetical protein